MLEWAKEAGLGTRQNGRGLYYIYEADFFSGLLGKLAKYIDQLKAKAKAQA